MTVNTKTSYHIDYKFWDGELKCEVIVTLMHLGVRLLLWSKYLVHGVIACRIVKTLFSKKNPNHLIKQKDKKFPLKIDFME